MGTIATTIKVTADARSAVTGLKPLQTSLDKVTTDANQAESALKDLDKSHAIKLNDAAIDTARKEISTLRQQMAKDLSIDANADVRSAQTRIRQLQSAVRTLDAETIDINAAINVDDSDLQDVEGSLSTLGGSGSGSFLGTAGGIAAMSGKLGGLAKFAGPIGIGVAGIAGIGIAANKTLSPLIGLADKMENAKIAFTQFLGSEPAADKFLNNLQQFAAKTPFEFPELVDSSKKLLAFGVDGDDVIGTMTTLGDAAALTGADVGDLATIWGQMSAKGKVSNEELLQLTEQGVPAYDALAQSMGKSVPQIQKMASEGKLLSDNTLPKLKAGLDKTFGGGMAKQSATLSGKMSTLGDTFTAMGTDIGDALLPFAKSIVDEVQPALDDLAGWVSEHKGDIAKAITTGAAAVLDYGAGIIDMWGYVVGGIGDVIEWVGHLVVKIGEAGQALSDLPGIPDDLGDDTVAVGKAMEGFGEKAQGVGDAMHGAADGMRDAGDNAIEFGDKMAEGFKTDAAREELSKLQTHIDELKKKPPSPEIDAKIEKAEEKVRKIRGDLREIKQTETQARVDAKTTTATKKLKDIRASLKYLRSQKPTPEVKADIKEWEAKYRRVKADLKDLHDTKTLSPIESLLLPAALRKVNTGLNTTAKPGGKGRDAPINPKVEDEAQVRQTLGDLTKTETKWIDVFYRVHGSPSGGGGGGGDGKTGLAPQPAPTIGSDGLMAAGQRLTASPTQTVLGASHGGVVGQVSMTAPASEPTQLAPRQTPIKVYLDGAEIADHLTLKAGRMASVTPVKRRA